MRLMNCHEQSIGKLYELKRSSYYEKFVPLRHLFTDQMSLPKYVQFNGLAWLFLGVPTSSSLLYKEVG